jgi:hypothetical protein
MINTVFKFANWRATCLVDNLDEQLVRLDVIDAVPRQVRHKRMQ